MRKSRTLKPLRDLQEVELYFCSLSRRLGQVALVMANIKHTVRIRKCKLEREYKVIWRDDQLPGPFRDLLQSEEAGKKL